MSTFPSLIAARLASAAEQPFLTYYDDSSGERTELSVRTFANWVTKTANLLADDLMLDPDDTVRIDLGPHWLGAVFVGAAWTAGLTPVVDGEADDVDLLVVGPDGLSRTAPTVLACSLTPFATRFTTPLPDHVTDYGLEWPGQPDDLIVDSPTELPAVAGNDDRVLTDLDLASPAGRDLLLALLAGTGSMVLVGHPDDERWPAHYASERATAAVRSRV